MDRDAAAVGHHDALNVAEAADHTLRADVIGPVHLLDVATARVLIVTVQRLKQFADGDVERAQGIRIDRHLVLLQVAPEAVDLHNARDARELPLHDPILNRAQLHRVVLIGVGRIHLQGILINLAQTGRDRHQLGRAQLLGDVARHRLDLLVDQLPGLQRRHRLVEHHRHQREAEAAHRANLLHLHDVAHGNLDREGDQLLHLLGSQRRRDRHDLHLIIGNIGHRIYGQCPHRIQATHEEQERGQPHEELSAYREMNNLLKHFFASI